MRLAWLAPLPPTPSGVADYAAAMAPLVAERARVDVFGTGRGQRVPGLRVRPIERFVPSSYDLAVYHLGNNAYHSAVYAAARRHPGVVVLHDLVLHHFLGTHARGPWRGWLYEEPLAEEYGDLGRRVARLADLHLDTRAQMFLFPMVAHLTRRARGVVVHTEAARRAIEADAPEIPVATIPHFAPPAPSAVDGVDREEARRRVGLPGDAFVVGHFGFLTPPKQPAAVLEGFATLRAQMPGALLALVGADEFGADLPGTVPPRSVLRAGYVDLERFHLFLRAADAVVSLRYPSAGEASGALVRALSEGRPVIANDLPSLADVPAEALVRVRTDEPLGPQVGEALIRLAADAQLRARVGEAARWYARSELDPRRCAARYVSFAAAV